MKVLSFAICTILTLTTHPIAAKTLEGQWQVKGSDVIVGLSTNPQMPGGSKNIFLIVKYASEFNCKPVVSLLVMTGTKLGTPTKQKTSKSKKNQLVVGVGSKEYTNETKMTEYTNGFELAMFGARELIDSLSDNSQRMYARVGELELLSFSRVANFNSASRQAKVNCN
jgi:hypothetical protein